MPVLGSRFLGYRFLKWPRSEFHFSAFLETSKAWNRGGWNWRRAWEDGVPCCPHSLSCGPHIRISFRLAMTSQGQSLNSTLDDNCQGNFRGTLLTIDSYLGDQDVERLKFLCRDSIAPKNLEKCGSALDIFEYLLAEEWLSEEDPFFLAELLYTIKQKVLLRHLRYTKEQVENCLPFRRKVSLFRWSTRQGHWALKRGCDSWWINF